MEVGNYIFTRLRFCTDSNLSLSYIFARNFSYEIQFDIREMKAELNRLNLKLNWTNVTQNKHKWSWCN